MNKILSVSALAMVVTFSNGAFAAFQGPELAPVTIAEALQMKDDTAVVLNGQIEKSLGNEIYYAIIPRNVRLAEAPSHGLPIIAYDPKSKGAEGYRFLGEQVAEKEWN